MQRRKIYTFGGTININPQSWITIPTDDAFEFSKRAKWGHHFSQDQKNFIQWYFIDKASDHNVQLTNYGWELTEIGNVHLHFTTKREDSDGSDFKGLIDYFCDKVDTKMSDMTKARVVFLTTVSCEKLWNKYVDKEKPLDRDFIPAKSLF